MTNATLYAKTKHTCHRHRRFSYTHDVRAKKSSKEIKEKQRFTSSRLHTPTLREISNAQQTKRLALHVQISRWKASFIHNRALVDTSSPYGNRYTTLGIARIQKTLVAREFVSVSSPGGPRKVALVGEAGGDLARLFPRDRTPRGATPHIRCIASPLGCFRLCTPLSCDGLWAQCLYSPFLFLLLLLYFFSRLYFSQLCASSPSSSRAAMYLWRFLFPA